MMKCHTGDISIQVRHVTMTGSWFK